MARTRDSSTARETMQTSDLQWQRDKFCQQPHTTWKWVFSWSRFQMRMKLSNIAISALWDPGPKTQPKYVEYLRHKNCEIINLCCSMLLRVLICSSSSRKLITCICIGTLQNQVFIMKIIYVCTLTDKLQ